ncbi:hypothetical protein [Streptomyces sp. NPDC002588]|uniref:hypothetical protein n=1 Tax=Streptomyces sp. NPDC002588 TaxID=3154419 RepID=UPI003329AD9C
MVERSRCGGFVHDAAAGALAADIASQLPDMTRWLRPGDDVVDLDRLTEQPADRAPELGAFHEDGLALILASGTTGLPKAVVHTHARIPAAAQR